MSYLKSFVIGSSYITLLPFLTTVIRLENINYTYGSYSLIAPLYLGLMNMLSLYLSKKLDLTLRKRMLMIGIISPLIVILISYMLKTYNFEGYEWIIYGIRLVIKHLMVYNIIMYLLEKNI